MIILIDFDNTIAKEEYPRIGYIYPLADHVIRRWYEDGNEIVINTCRIGEEEAAVYRCLKENEIPYDYINCNIPRLIESFGKDCRKLFGDINIDDKNLGGLPKTKEGHVDWVLIDQVVRNHPKYIGDSVVISYISLEYK